MTLLEHFDHVIEKAITKHAEANGIVIPDYDKFASTNGKEYIFELIYLYSSYEDLLLMTISAIMIKADKEDLDCDVEFKKKPALYLKFGEYNLKLRLKVDGDIATTKDDRSWMVMSVEGHYHIEQNASAMGFLGVAKKAKKYRKQLLRHLDLK